MEGVRGVQSMASNFDTLMHYVEKKETLLGQTQSGQGYLNFGQKHNSDKTCLLFSHLKGLFLAGTAFPQCFTKHKIITHNPIFYLFLCNSYGLTSGSTHT